MKKVQFYLTATIWLFVTSAVVRMLIALSSDVKSAEQLILYVGIIALITMVLVASGGLILTINKK